MNNRSAFKVFSRLILLVKPLSFHMILAIITGVLGFLAAMFLTILGAFAITNVLGLEFGIDIKLIYSLIIILALSRGFLRYAEQTFNHYIAFKLLALIRDRVFKALRKLAPAKLEVRDKGDLIALITSDIELLEVFYAHTISPVAIAIIISIIMITFLSTYHYVLGMIAFFAYASIGIIMPYIMSNRNQKLADEYRKKFGEMNSYFLESMRGIKEIIQFNYSDIRLKNINEKTDSMSSYEEKFKKNIGINFATTSLVVMSFSILMLLSSSYLYSNQEIGFGGVIVSTVTMFSSFGAVIAIANLGTGLSQTIASGNRVLNLLDENPVVEENIDGISIEFGGANFEKVNFSYDDIEILKDFDLQIPTNRIIGLSGKSGVGKSTALRLLMRFWDVNSGSIYIKSDGIDVEIKDIMTSSLRDNQSYVTQETQLFHTSILDNIRIAKLDATDEEIVDACKKASVHDFIMTLPDGYNSIVSELGDSLSGGEKQRIGVARAFLNNAPLMLLDEPTSNLDSLNEAVILKSLKEDVVRSKNNKESRTIVLVSHRLSTMRVADEVHNFESKRHS